MNFEDAERLVSKFKTRPIKTVFVLVVLVLFAVIIAYLSGFFGEKGKQHSLSSTTNTGITTAAPRDTVKNKTNNDGVTINQRTQGDQSPSIVSEGNVTIEYDTRKHKSGKE